MTQGGYSTHVVVDQDFVLSAPEGIGLAEAAPLLCAGITAFSPLRRWGAGPGTKVAVMGLGGLGHLAVKLARTMGADVTVLSQSLQKRDAGDWPRFPEYVVARRHADSSTALGRSVRVARPTVPTILLPFKITVKGAPAARPCSARQTLEQ